LQRFQFNHPRSVSVPEHVCSIRAFGLLKQSSIVFSLLPCTERSSKAPFQHLSWPRRKYLPSESPWEWPESHDAGRATSKKDERAFISKDIDGSEEWVQQQKRRVIFEQIACKTIPRLRMESKAMPIEMDDNTLPVPLIWEKIRNDVFFPKNAFH
jgi:hypothetical protein